MRLADASRRIPGTIICLSRWHENRTFQALRDALTTSQYYFRLFPGVDIAELRMFR